MTFLNAQEKPRKSYITDEEEAGSSDYSDDLESTSKGDTWTKSPRKEKTNSALSSSPSPSAASSSPPSVSSRSVSVADRGDKVSYHGMQRNIYFTVAGWATSS